MELRRIGQTDVHISRVRISAVELGPLGGEQPDVQIAQLIPLGPGFV